MTNIYIVAERGWEYNDERYYFPESDGGVPRRAFKSAEDASSHAAMENANFLKNCRLGDYTEDFEYVIESVNQIITKELIPSGYDIKEIPDESDHLEEPFKDIPSHILERLVLISMTQNKPIYRDLTSLFPFQVFTVPSDN